ncbi:MAG TPA: ABC transporter permease subunit [Phototrophicaceae bacterium]|nr:ABC transporter permease subunit [Phototrophicaceae bacterium]
MTGVVLLNTLRRNWRQAIYWGISIGILGYYVIVLVPNMDTLKQYEDLVAKMPPLMLKAFGLSDAAQMATPAGFLGFGFFSYMLLVLATYAVLAGLSITSSEEDRGILDVLLSLPIPRWRIIIERLIAYTLILIVMLVITFAGLWIGAATTPGLNLDLGRLLAATVNMLPATLLVLAFTALAGAVARTRTLAIGVATVFVVASYFIDFLGAAASGTFFDSLRVISFYSWYNGGQIMFTGLEAGRVLLLLAVALICALGSLWFFQRRDIV